MFFLSVNLRTNLADTYWPANCALSEPSGQFTIRLELQGPPGELDQAVSNANVARSGQPFLAPFLATLIRQSRQATIARQCTSARYLAKENLTCQHVGRVESQATDRRELLNHGVMLKLLILSDLLFALLFHRRNLPPVEG